MTKKKKQVSSTPAANREKANSHHLISATRAIQRSGPLPSPEDMAEYEKVLPGLANRIVKMAENEAKHRHKTEEKWLKKTFTQQRIGQIFGLIIGMTAIITGGIAAIKGAQIAGSLFGFGGVAALVYAFIHGSKIKQ